MCRRRCTARSGQADARGALAVRAHAQDRLGAALALRGREPPAAGSCSRSTTCTAPTAQSLGVLARSGVADQRASAAARHLLRQAALAHAPPALEQLVQPVTASSCLRSSRRTRASCSVRCSARCRAWMRPPAGCTSCRAGQPAELHAIRAVPRRPRDRALRRRPLAACRRTCARTACPATLDAMFEAGGRAQRRRAHAGARARAGA